jgi:hypothetical protein
MSAGKTSVTQTPTLDAAQEAQVEAQNQFFTGTVAPTYTSAVQNATNLYNQTSGGVTNAAQNLASVANQAQQTEGSTGESALNTGVSGLESLFSPNYEANQVAAALQPAQAQYLQNQANLGAQFGGAGELGSSRDALAAQQLATTNAASEANTAAQVEANVANQQSTAANNLAGIGQTNLAGAQTAASNAVNAAMTPQQLYNQYASVIFGTPSSSYSLGPTGTSGTTTNAGIKI